MDTMERSKQVDFQRLLDAAVRFHGHLCGGQIIGTRMALAGLRELNIEDPRGAEGRDLVIFVETDRCAVDAIIVVTGRTPGKRSIKMMDYGKVAATFVDARCGRAVRVSVRGDAHAKAQWLVQTHLRQNEAKQAMLTALMAISDTDLLRIQRVSVEICPQDLPGGLRETVTCRKCGATVSDGRQVNRHGEVLCKPCALGGDYYTVLDEGLSLDPEGLNQ